MIDGVQVVPLRRIPDERGTIFPMLKCTDTHFCQFGEIYFTTIYPGVIKGWHKHRNDPQLCLYRGPNQTCAL